MGETTGMELRGHLGTALILSAESLVLLGPVYGTAATVVMLALTPVPDWDLYISESVVKHRGPTHSLAFALVASFVLASAIAYPARLGQRIVMDYGVLSSGVVSPFRMWLFLFCAGTASLVGHLLTDTLTYGGGYKVEPFWPLSSWTLAFGLCHSDDEEWNTALLASGMTAFLAAGLHELYYSVLPKILGIQ